MKKNSYPVTNIGSVSLLMTFIVLCLVIFATLALSGAVSEYQYSRKIADYNSDYYQASNTAVQTLREIDGILHDAHASSPDDYDTAVRAMLSEAAGSLGDLTVDFAADGSVTAITYQVPINDTQTLRVILTLNSPAQWENGYFRITAWQKIPAAEWNGDDSLELISF